MRGQKVQIKQNTFKKTDNTPITDCLGKGFLPVAFMISSQASDKEVKMQTVTIIRHGQANTGARDEASYDKLSALGHQQAHWLGAHLKDTYMPFQRIVSGTLKRQIETANGVNQFDLPHLQDARLNELNYFGMAECLKRAHNVPYPKTQTAFAQHLQTMLEYWQADKLDPALESYISFHQRIRSVILEGLASQTPSLLVSSTGVIASLAGDTLNTDPAHLVKLFMAVGHTSLSQFQLINADLTLTQFAAKPHLEPADRTNAQTYI